MILKHSASDSSVLQNTRQELGLLRVSVVGENTINGRRTKSHLRLVDLPGSERIGRNGVEVNDHLILSPYAFVARTKI
ncbi:hypothetical protein ACS0TY_023263 [Phlomoides rotata]